MANGDSGNRTNSVFIESRGHALGSLAEQGEKEWQNHRLHRFITDAAAAAVVVIVVAMQ